MPNAFNLHYMQHALRLAARGLGHVWPNPAVGAVVVKNGIIVGRGYTARGGRPHAETEALGEAGADAQGATMYVTLEPCSHHGKTPPCAEAIIKAGIAHVVVACRDSNPKVSGKGIEMLRKAGIEVVEGVCEAEARKLNQGFFSVMERGRPFVAVKIATSLDGCTVTGKEEGRWITGEDARTRGHLLRATHDAILTGIGTVLADDPELTCRLPGRENDSPQRVVLDSNLRIPLNAKILPAWIFTSEKPASHFLPLLGGGKEGVSQNSNPSQPLPYKGREYGRIFIAKEQQGRLSLSGVLTQLADQGITRLLVEGGKTLTDAFIGEGLADRIYWFRSPEVIGTEASRVSAPAFAAASIESLGKDKLEIYECC